jgi:hypothetical protein
MSNAEPMSVSIRSTKDALWSASPAPGAPMAWWGPLAGAVILRMDPLILPAPIAGPAGPGPGDDDDDDEEDGGGSGGNIDPDDDEGYDDEDDDDDEEPLRCALSPR